MSKMAIPIWAGPMQKPPTLPGGSIRKCSENHQRKQAQTNVSVAHKAVAHKLARACYHMMRQQVPFKVTQAFG